MTGIKPFDIPLEGINLVEASAGTGKTYSIESLYIRAIIKEGLAVDRILVVTYTEAAMKELRVRLMERLRKSMNTLLNGRADANDSFLNDLLQSTGDREQAVERLREAIHHFDEAAVHTIHGFCYQVLQDRAFYSGAIFDAEMIGDDSEIIQESVDDFWRRWTERMSSDELKRPLLKLVLSGYTPDGLADAMKPAVGKPYLRLLPAEDPLPDLENDLKRLNHLYGEMRELWEKERSQILELLDSEHLKYYNHVEKWASEMDDLLSNSIPVVQLFSMFKKFTADELKNSLKVDSERAGVSPPTHRFFEYCNEYQDLSGRLNTYDIHFKKELFEHLREDLPLRKEELGVFSYDDLLTRLRSALYEDSRGEQLAEMLWNRYPLALVDEFQDTDPVQYDIFRSMYGGEKPGCGLFMIGDPKQSIYSFRGADIFAYLKARNDAREEKIYPLSDNYRSVPELIGAVNGLFSIHKNPFVIDRISFQGVNPGWPDEEYERFSEEGVRPAPLQIRHISPRGDTHTKETAAALAASDTAAEIARLIDGGRRGTATIGNRSLQARDISVLVRKHDQADRMRDALLEYDIKSVLYSQDSVFHSEEAGQLERILGAVAEPASELRLKAALSTEIMGRTANELLDYGENEEKWVAELERFAGWHTLWQEHGIARMFRAMLREEEVEERLVGLPRGERKLTNLLHLGELLQEREQKHRGEMRSMVRYLARKRKEEYDNRGDEEQLRLESDEELVKIVTMHKSKGLEYPVVFCPFLWDGPDLKDNGKLLMIHDAGDPDWVLFDLRGRSAEERGRIRTRAATEELAESMRLAYVAVTRAKQRCYLMWIRANGTLFSALAHLIEGGEAVVENIQRKIDPEQDSPEEDWAVFEEGLRRLSAGLPDLIEVKEISGEGPSVEADETGKREKEKLVAQAFSRDFPLRLRHAVSSFSSLTRRDTEAELPDYDGYYAGLFEDPEPDQVREKTPFAFPRGPQPGTCIHKIFEEIDFEEYGRLDEIVSRSLETYGIEEGWAPAVRSMVENTLKAPLVDSGFQLGELRSSDRLSELEFYYPTGRVELREILQVIREEGENGTSRGIAEPGFIKGFIDLTFRTGGRYYILDYKTNYLGDDFDDYTPDRLREEILGAHYDVQYHLYALALHRFLRRRLPGYSYEKHFGGAYYLFVRGINPDNGKSGIFYDRPGKDKIDRLDRCLIEGGAV